MTMFHFDYVKKIDNYYIKQLSKYLSLNNPCHFIVGTLMITYEY